MRQSFMRQSLISAAALAVSLVSGPVLAASESDIEGLWETEGGGYVQVHKEGDHWNGTVVGSRDGEARYDEENPDDDKRGRRLLGVTVLTGLKYDGEGEWNDGQIYSPDNGKTYKGKAEMKDADTLELRGYVGVSMLGKDQTWTRIDKDAPNLETDELQ